LYAQWRGHMSMHYMDGLRGRELVCESLGAALREALSAKKREIVAHTSTREPRSASEMRYRLDLATRGVPSEVAHKALNGIKVDSKLTVDLDQTDLLKGL